MRLDRVLFVTAATFGLLLVGSPARADITAFLGAAGGPSTRVAAGLAVGAAAGPLGWEFEYSHVSSDEAEGSPSLQTFMINGIGQTPFVAGRMQFYGTLGAGLFHEDLLGDSKTNLGVNGGLGVKMAAYGPLRVRFDYRLTRLVGSAFGSKTIHRFYVGANIRF